MFGIATTELVHSKDGYITHDDYKSVTDPGERPRASPSIFTPNGGPRAEKKFFSGLDDRASPLSEGLHGSVSAYQPS